MDYAEDYLTRIDFFRQIENRKNHYPYLRRIAKLTDIDQVMEVIAEYHTNLQQAKQMGFKDLEDMYDFFINSRRER